MRIVLFVALAGCSSLDDEVFTSLTHATLRADPANSTGLADVQIELKLSAGPRADRTVVLSEVFVTADAQPKQDLAVAFPATFDVEFDRNEVRTTTLVNVGTTNAELAPLCGVPVSISAMVGYVPDDGFTGSGLYELTVACP